MIFIHISVFVTLTEYLIRVDVLCFRLSVRTYSQFVIYKWPKWSPSKDSSADDYIAVWNLSFLPLIYSLKDCTTWIELSSKMLLKLLLVLSISYYKLVLYEEKHWPFAENVKVEWELCRNEKAHFFTDNSDFQNAYQQLLTSYFRNVTFK